jgi:raffinose/stachyose/melibiose transport system permease protein
VKVLPLLAGHKEKQGNYLTKLNWAIYLVLIIQTIIVLLPLIWLLLSSLKTQADLTWNIWGLPKKLIFSNYYVAWTRGRMAIYMLNSIVVVLVSVILTVVLCTPVAYVLARIPFKLNRPIFYIILAGMMIPIHSAIIPLYMMVNKLKMQDNLLVLSTVYAAFRIPFSVFILEGFMSSIPKELEECAIIDGCGICRILTKIIAPLSAGGIATIAILTVLSSWNELLISMLFISQEVLKTLPIGLMGFIAEYNSQYTQLCAGILIALVPSLIFYVLAQDKIVKGMIAGAIKG